MIKYSRDEMVGVTEFGKSIGGFLDKVRKNPSNRLVLVRHNKPEVVMVPIEEYEKMAILEEYIEQKEIYDIAQERVENRKTTAKFFSYEEVMEMINKRLDNV